MTSKSGHRAAGISFLMLALAVALAVPALAAERAPMEIGTDGLTPEEFLAQRIELNAWLTRELPVRPLDDPIRITLTPGERKSLEQLIPSGPGPVRIGLVKAVTPGVAVRGLDRQRIPRLGGPFAGGVIQETSDGGFVWARTISSEGASGLRVHLAAVNLPPTADLYFFGRSGEAYGPYQRRGPDGTGEFWTNSVRDSEATLILRQFGPATPDELRQLSFVVSAVGHIGPQFPEKEERNHVTYCGNEICVVDISCSTAPNHPATNAVAKMEWISGAFIYTCTGGRISDNDGNPNTRYFLTANHCLSRNKDAGNVEFFWHYRSNTCHATCPNDNTFPRTMGSSVAASGRAGDFTLLQLSTTPPGTTVALGWNNSPIASTNNATLSRVSHPNFGAQVYSRHRVDTSAPTCSGWPRGERIYSRDTEGATDGGSSGSPVLNSVNEIVGQLSGGCGFNVGDVCDHTSNATVDGALAFYWSSVQPFLNPSGCTPTTEVCTDGVDNDCDGAIDCADSDCSGNPACGGGGCTLGQPGDQCTSDAQCCSTKCKGKPGSQTCR